MAHGIVGILATGSKLVDVCVFVLFPGEGLQSAAGKGLIIVYSAADICASER